MVDRPPMVALLDHVAAKLGDAKQAQILGSLAQRIILHHSCLTDLNYCQHLLELLEQGFTAASIDERQGLLIQHSILSNAVVLYARATNGGSMFGGRGSIDVTPKLSAEEQASHESVIQFRNKTIAHVHIAHDMEGYAWNPSFAVVVDEGDGYRLGAVSRPLSMQQGIWNHLKSVAPVSQQIISSRFDKYIDKAAEMIADFEEFDVIDNCMQDSGKLLGSDESARAVLGGRAGGSTFGVGRDN